MRATNAPPSPHTYYLVLCSSIPCEERWRMGVLGVQTSCEETWISVCWIQYLDPVCRILGLWYVPTVNITLPPNIRTSPVLFLSIRYLDSCGFLNICSSEFELWLFFIYLTVHSWHLSDICSLFLALTIICLTDEFWWAPYLSVSLITGLWRAPTYKSAGSPDSGVHVGCQTAQPEKGECFHFDLPLFDLFPRRIHIVCLCGKWERGGETSLGWGGVREASLAEEGWREPH